MPTGRVLWRASLPVRTVPTASLPVSGVGDFDVFGAYLAVQKPDLTFGLGQVTKVNDIVFNIFIEPRFTVLVEGTGQPMFQVFTGLNMQFN